ncbi:serine/threonine-protein kinase [Nocardioides sp.]|jgi:serine/threonine protein kinase|uniref:serine/threonine-protein kinase n=1 Tax=Nocardioides sp. TaxID=35761 RepID=UPI0026284542|nr:serine/threonine-protein kinase [Nocardioides sp.]
MDFSTSDAASSVPVGPGVTVANRYVLGSLVGRGGVADVYRADDTVLSRQVAVKVLRDVAGSESDRARFVAEARTLANLGHHGLVTVLDAGLGGDHMAQPFLVMELVDGQTLAAQIARGPLDERRIEEIARQLADAVAYAHGRDVVHRDVKPGNVLLHSSGAVKLADFGIARLIGDTVRHTQTGHAVGTAAYLAPEQVLGEQLTTAVDVYSLGLVLLEMFTGRLTYPGPPTEAALARLSRQPEVPADVPAGWRDLIVAMTARVPGDRPHAGQVREALGPRGSGAVRAPATPSPQESPVATAVLTDVMAPLPQNPPQGPPGPPPAGPPPAGPPPAGPPPAGPPPAGPPPAGPPPAGPPPAGPPRDVAASVSDTWARIVGWSRGLDSTYVALAGVALVFLLLLVATALAG